MKQITAKDIDSMEQRFRALFVNSLSGFKSANLVGTVSDEGVDNLAIVSSVFHIGANPPLMGMITRPHTVRRDSLENLRATGFYTFNHVHSGMLKQAHQTSARYEADVSEFDAVGLTPFHSDTVKAPYVREARLRIGLQLEEIKPLEINQTELVIGRIVEVFVDDQVIAGDGFIDLEALETVAISSLDSYHSASSLGRLTYAKPDKQPEFFG